jgi:hypothetical protein
VDSLTQTLLPYNLTLNTESHFPWVYFSVDLILDILQVCVESFLLYVYGPSHLMFLRAHERSFIFEGPGNALVIMVILLALRMNRRTFCRDRGLITYVLPNVSRCLFF